MEKAREGGQRVLDSMAGKSATEFSFKRSNQVISHPVPSHPSKLMGTRFRWLFQCLIIACQSLDNM